MGEKVRVTCDKCKFDKDILVGCGRLATRLDVIKDMLKDDELSEFTELEKQKRLKSYNWEYVIGYCKECKEIESAGKVICIIADDEKKVFGEKCSLCGKKVQIISVKADKKCLLCGDGKLTSQFAGFWD